MISLDTKPGLLQAGVDVITEVFDSALAGTGECGASHLLGGVGR